MDTARFYITAKHAAFAVTGVDEILKLVLNNFVSFPSLKSAGLLSFPSLLCVGLSKADSGKLNTVN
jgi:hypothetical protein